MRKPEATFHKGADYAAVMLEGQTTENALVQLFGTDEQIEHYGLLIEAAVNADRASPERYRLKR